jgi:hypothetical protein
MKDYAVVSEFEPGLTRSFGEPDIGPDVLSSGWSFPEEGHAWNDGIEAALTLAVPRLTSACEISFAGEPFLNGTCEVQNMTLFVNGFRIRSWRLNEKKSYLLTAPIEPEQIFHRENTSYLKCVWYLPDAVRPSALGVNSDDRELAFCFRYLTII